MLEITKISATDFDFDKIKTPTAYIKGKELFFDADKLPKGAKIRLREEGDRFKKFGGGEKKLKDFFIDIKVPQRVRDFLPLVVFNNQVLCIADIGISETVKIDEQTKNIIRIRLKNE